MRKAISVLLILLLLFSFTYAAIESVHDCEGDECPICRIIAVLSLLFAGVVICFISVLSFLLFSRKVPLTKSREAASSTLIDLFVKLSS